MANKKFIPDPEFWIRQKTREEKRKIRNDYAREFVRAYRKTEIYKKRYGISSTK